VLGMLAMMLVAVSPGVSSSLPGTAGLPTQMVITVHPPATLEAGDLTILQGKTVAPVTRLQRLAGEMADMQLFVLLDDSTRSSSLSLQLPELKTFIDSLPATTQIAVGYMRNGTFQLAQSFTADHQKAAHSLRLPLAMPGENGSPYFALSDLADHWPSKDPTDRRAVLMLTDGVDRYYTPAIMDDPYVDTAIRNALKQGVMVYTIYLRGAGRDGRSLWSTNVAQSRLSEVSEETGGYAYFQGFTDPVSISPFLKDLGQRFENQYLVTLGDLPEKGVQPVKLRTEMPGVKIDAPTRMYVR
jgi:hypothetical protein